MEQLKKAGFSRNDITPPLGVNISGYYDERICDGYLDPLFVNIICFEAGGRQGLLVVCDLLGCYSEAFADRMIDAAAETTGIDREAVFICHTHTHTGPQTDSPRKMGDPGYQDYLVSQIAKGAKEAKEDLAPVTGFFGGEGLTEGLAFVRRVKMKDGHYQTWAKNPDPDIECMASKADESFRVVRITRENADEIIIANFQNHPDMIGGTKISADFPGFFRNELERMRPGTKSVYVNGAEGQMTFYDYMHGTTGQGKGYWRPEKFGKDFAKYVSDLIPSLTEITGPDTVSYDHVWAPAKTKRDPARVPEALRLIALHESGRDEEISPLKRIYTPLVAEAYNLRELEEKKWDVVNLPLSFLTFGGLAFVGIPGEPFCEVGEIIRARSPYALTNVCCQTYKSYGYYPDAIAYDQDGYEPRNSRLAKGAAELMEDEAEKMLKKLYEE